jgi:4-hydroxy-4-methyl-2-oxoglutarate aldolase
MDSQIAHPQSQRVKDLLTCGSANVSDALRQLGRHFQAMDGGIRPVAPGMRAAGPAYTVRCYPGATWAMEAAMEASRPGDVIVADGAGSIDVILMGGLMGRRMHARGVAGAVVDGAVRDTEQLAAIGFSVFSRHVCPRAGTFAEIGEQQTIVCCGRIPVRPGDWVVADADGITVVPVELLDETITRAMTIHAREASIDVHLSQGHSIPEAAKRADVPSP